MKAAWPLSSVIPPGGASVLWGRTEYGVSADATTAGVNAVVLIHDGDRLDDAFVPQASFLPGNGAGARLGATARARFDSGRNSTCVTPHVNMVMEKATGQGITVALFEELEFQMIERMALAALRRSHSTVGDVVHATTING